MIAPRFTVLESLITFQTHKTIQTSFTYGAVLQMLFLKI